MTAPLPRYLAIPSINREKARKGMLITVLMVSMILSQFMVLAQGESSPLSPDGSSPPVEGWSDSIHIETNWNSSHGLDMAVDSQGNRHFVWINTDGYGLYSTDQLYYLRLSPSNDVLIDRVPVVMPSSPRITTATIVLNTNDTPIIIYKRTDGREREGYILYSINQVEIGSSGVILKDSLITNFSVKKERLYEYKCYWDELEVVIDSFNNIHVATCDTLLTLDQDGNLLKHHTPYAASSSGWIGSPSITLDWDDNLYIIWSRKVPNNTNITCFGTFTATYFKVFDYAGVVIVNNTLLQQGNCNGFPNHIFLDVYGAVNIIWKNDTFWGGYWQGMPYEPHEFKTYKTFYRSIIKNLSPLDVQTTLIHQTPSHLMSSLEYYFYNGNFLLGVGVSFDNAYHIFYVESFYQFPVPLYSFNHTYLITVNENSNRSTTFISPGVPISSTSVTTDERGRVYFAWIQHNSTKPIDFNYGNIYYRYTLQAGPPPPLPDLAVEREDLVLNPNPALPGVNITIEVTVVNLAPITAKNVVVQFLVDETVIGEMLFPKVKGYESIPIHWEWAPPDTGTYEIEIRVDPANNIRESDEENNRVQTTLRVVATPPRSAPSLLLTLPGMLFLIAFAAALMTRNRDFVR